MSKCRILFILAISYFTSLAAFARPPEPGTEDFALMSEFKQWVISQHASKCPSKIILSPVSRL